MLRMGLEFSINDEVYAHKGISWDDAPIDESYWQKHISNPSA
jgi:hypothetical protein